MSFIELCAGCGGSSYGLASNLTPLMIVDNDKDCCETLKLNGFGCVINSDFETINYEKYIDKCDLLFGGVPCQPFSQVGKRLGINDDRGKLIFEFIKIAKTIKPKIFVIENVKGLTTINNGKLFESVISAINDDYVTQTHIIDASNYEVPQKRERLFIIGLKAKYAHLFHFPSPSDKKIILEDVLKNVPPSECAKYSDRKVELFKKIPQGGCWINLPEDEQKEYLGKSYSSGGGKRGILHRLNIKKPSPTLLCSPSQKLTERCHPLEERPLSIREYARIQTFPDTYKFCGSVPSQYKQIGNAVPVKLATKIGEEISNYIHMCSFSGKIDDITQRVFSEKRKKKHKHCGDILLEEYYNAHGEHLHQSEMIRFIQMKTGLLWQMVIGSYDKNEDLKIGHQTGLDIINTTRKYVIELKNKHDTDNSSARKANFQKLAKFRKKHPDYECIYGTINDIDKMGKTKTVTVGKETVTYMSGRVLLDYIFGKNTDIIVSMLKKKIQEHIANFPQIDVLRERS